MDNINPSWHQTIKIRILHPLISRVMNAGSFLKYIKSPSLLHQLSYEELKTIALQYPFSANLHLLLLLKSKLDNHKDYKKNLALAAGHSINRAYLYKLLQKEDLLVVEHKGVLKEEDVLELKDLATLEKGMEKAPVLLSDDQVAPPDENKNLLEWEMPLETEAHIPDGNSSDDSDIPKASVEEKTLSEASPAENDLLSTMNALNDLIEGVIAQEEKSTDISENEMEEISNLTKALNELLPESEPEEEPAVAEKENEAPVAEEKKPIANEKVAELSEEISESPVDEKVEKADTPSKKKEKSSEKQKRRKVSEVAARSIKSQSRVASETLAIILEKQGLTDKAIKMYEQLILTFPEKSAYFAGKIENLKNL